MDTSNLHLSYFTDTLTFSRRIIVAGADPSHSPDLRKLGGVFHCYLEGGKRGWVFGIAMEPTLHAYLKTGEITGKAPTPRNGPKKDSGICTICKKNVKVDTALKNYTRYYV